MATSAAQAPKGGATSPNRTCRGTNKKRNEPAGAASKKTNLNQKRSRESRRFVESNGRGGERFQSKEVGDVDIGGPLPEGAPLNGWCRRGRGIIEQLVEVLAAVAVVWMLVFSNFATVLASPFVTG